MEIGKELAKQAKIKGICEDWYKDLKVTNDTGKLLTMYVKGIDFCLSKDWPDNEYIRAKFKGKMEEFGIHLDEEFNCINNKRVIALGKCTGNISNDGYTVSEVFLKHDSVVTIHAKGDSFTMIDMFDNSCLSIAAHDNAKVVINHYGGEITFDKFENAQIKVKEKERKTY